MFLNSHASSLWRPFFRVGILLERDNSERLIRFRVVLGSHTILAEFLKEHGVDARIIFFEEHVKTVAAAAKRLGVGPERIIKSVLFIDDRGGPVLAIVRGDRRVSEFRLAKMIGVRSVRIATPEETRIHTGYDVGAVPPVGLRPGLRVVIDAEVMRLERVYGGGGSGNALVEISPSDIQRLTGGVVGEIVVPT